jgi:putative DNA primase/helicase
MTSSVHQAEATRAPTFWAAPDLAKEGYPVFPVGLDKEPSVRGGFYAATRDISQIAAWIEEGRGDHDIAFPTGLPTLTVIIDADTAEAYARMVSAFGEPAVKTERGGHWYFAHPQDGKVTSRRFAPGLDCKADGGYVIVPPSRNRAWVGAVPDLGNLPSLSKDLKSALREERSEGRKRHGGGLGEIGREIADGNRNETLTSLAGTMRRRGMCEEEIFGALVVTNRVRCKPPLSEEEVRRICASVARYEPDDRPWWVQVVKKNG